MLAAATAAAAASEAADTTSPLSRRCWPTGSLNVNLQDGAGETALMWAAIHGNRTMIRTLLDARADIRLTNVEGRAAGFGPLLQGEGGALGFQEL